VLAGVLLLTLAVLARRPLPGPAEPDRAHLTNPYVVWSAEDAIALSLDEFPPDRNPHGAVARLIREDRLEDWAGWWTVGSSGDAPMWLVAILGDNLTEGDYVISEGMTDGADPMPDPTPIEGIFYAWDANAGHQVASGALMANSLMSYASVVSMPQDPLEIQPATPKPTLDPNATPDPES
jgi:hypothetical protein